MSEEDHTAEHSVADIERAERTLEELKELKDKRAEIMAHADNEMKKIAEWKVNMLGKVDRQTLWLENGLQAFLWNSGKKTLSLIHGTMRRIAGRERIEIDADKFSNWYDVARVANSAVDRLMKIEMTPIKKNIADFIKASGEIPEGVEVIKGVDSFTVDC